MKILLLPPSDQELLDAISYYNEQQKGLGARFYNEFLGTISLIEKAPNAWRKIGKFTHRINLSRFPYLVLYVVENDKIIITCIAHQHRKPDYYISRLI